MANEAIYAYGTQKTLEASGASFASGTLLQANDAAYSTDTDGAGFPDAVFVLKIQFGTTTSIENKAVSLFARPLNIDGTNDAPVPTATYTEKFIGAFVLSASAASTDQYLAIEAYNLPKEAEYYIANGSGQVASAGWSLKVTPRSYKPS